MHLTCQCDSSLPLIYDQPEDYTTCRIGLLIRRIRLIRGFSQEDLAKLTNTHLSYINAIENHASNVSIKKLMEICIGLDVDCSLFMRLLEQDAFRTNDDN